MTGRDRGPWTWTPAGRRALLTTMLRPAVGAFGESVRVLRMERGLSQGYLAGALSVDRSLISAVERGRRRPSSSLTVGIADALALTERERVALAERVDTRARLRTR